MTGIWGKFSGGQGGLEGRNPSPKEGFLRLQGLSFPYPLINPTNTETIFCMDSTGINS